MHWADIDCTGFDCIVESIDCYGRGPPEIQTNQDLADEPLSLSSFSLLTFSNSLSFSYFPFRQKEKVLPSVFVNSSFLSFSAFFCSFLFFYFSPSIYLFLFIAFLIPSGSPPPYRHALAHPPPPPKLCLRSLAHILLFVLALVRS